MQILALDTCFDGCSVCVAERQGDVVSVLSQRFERFETGHAERLVPMIGEAMHEARLNFDHIQRVAVTVGPGTFTGTRIGIAAARSLALATGADTVGVSSLAVMADVARREVGAVPFTVLVDARRGEVYMQSFGPGGGIDAAAPPALLSLAEAGQLGEGGESLLVGSGAAAAAAGYKVRVMLPDLLPDAVALAHIAAKLPASELPVVPLYLRPPDAKPQDGKAVARA